MSEDSKAPLTDAVSEVLGFGAILREARRQDKAEREKGYWILCPSCGRRIVKKEFVKKGCYACGWKEGADNSKSYSYRTNCPNCGTQVVTEHLIKKGCFICEWKTEDREQGTEDRRLRTGDRRQRTDI